MKKTVLAILMTMMTTTAYARLEKCTAANGGVLFQGENGQNYCISQQTMNWWSCFSWCKAVGGELATVNEACPDTGFETCTNIAGKQTKVNKNVWLATTSGSYTHFMHVGTGKFDDDRGISYGGRKIATYCLCY